MRFSLYRLNIAYEMAFKEPAFEVPQSAVGILTAFYRALSPRFPPLRMSDLQVAGGGALSDVAVRVGLLSLNGLLEVSVEKFTGNFQALQTEEQITTVKDCIALSEEALAKALPEVEAGATAIRTTSWIKCEGGVSASQELLKRYGDSGLGMPIEKFEATGINYSPTAQLRNEAERWGVTFLLERSAIEQAHLYFMCNATYMDGGRYNSLDERAQHIRAMYLGILQHFGLEPEPRTEQ